MRRSVLDSSRAACRSSSLRQPFLNRAGRRYVQISATPSSTEPTQTLNPNGNGNSSPSADARFEVLSSPFSLLSASISASQNLYTRKGTLVGFNGKPENAVSTLSLLGPLRRAFLGVPFIYQRVTSTTPYTALIATKSAITSMVIVHLDGRLDWMVTQRNALLAWTGHTLSLSPRVNTSMSIAHWGNTHATGRGLLALSGKGQIHQITLKTGEEYVVHPSNLVAYSMQQHAPTPYRFKANLLKFQIPNPTNLLPNTRFWQTMRESTVWRFTRNAAFTLRTWGRKTIWGDRLFLHFKGPANIIIQSRGGHISDVLTTRDVNEIADSPAGSVTEALTSPAEAGTATIAAPVKASPTTMSYASVNQGKVNWQKPSQ